MGASVPVDGCWFDKTGVVTEQSWEQVRDGSMPTGGWVEATANGLGALVCWVAGPANTCRRPAAVRDRHTEVLVLTNGATVRQPSVLSDADLGSIDEDIDTYLAAAGVPPVPRGYAWFIRRPGACASDQSFWAAINRGMAEVGSEAREPLDHRLALNSVLQDLYCRQ